MDSYEHLDGPKFLRLATRLPMYQGCLARRLEMERAEEEDSMEPEVSYESEQYEGPRTMSMSEAVARKKGGDQAVLDQLNQDGMNSAFGPLFERTVVSKG